MPSRDGELDTDSDPALVAMPERGAKGGLDSLSHLLGKLQAGQSALRKECETIGDRVGDLTGQITNLYGEIRAVREWMAARSALERKPDTKPRKPWDQSVGDLIGTIGIQALKVVGIGAVVAIILWAVANAKLSAG